MSYHHPATDLEVVRVEHVDELIRQLWWLWERAAARGHDSAHGYAAALDRAEKLRKISESVIVYDPTKLWGETSGPREK